MTTSAANRRTLRIGTRGSQLARWQAEWVAGELRRLGHCVELVEIATRGDVERGRAIGEIGTRGVFTKEIQRALLAQDVDLAVHSMKDLPTEPVDGLVIAAVPPRESVADVLALPRVAGEDSGVAEDEPQASPQRLATRDSLTLNPSHPMHVLLPANARIGTGSLRRQAQLRHARPELQCADVRGNVETRLRKLDEGQFDAIVLAEAGLRRLGLADRINYVLPLEIMLPAVGQGALAIECRVDDKHALAAIAPLDDSTTHAAVIAERALLAHLRGGCMAPVGALGKFLNDVLYLSAVVLSADGTQQIDAEDSAPAEEAERLGHRVADSLLAQGAAELIAASRNP